MTPADAIAAVLSPHLGAHTADVVARHLCAKFEVGEAADAAQQDQLREFLQRGLVVYVGPEEATRLAAECMARAFPPPATKG
jgi:hypothetical protein